MHTMQVGNFYYVDCVGNTRPPFANGLYRLMRVFLLTRLSESGA